MLLKLYHASLNKIKDFNLVELPNGTHLGGIYSAAEAALRRMTPRDKAYIHTVILDTEGCQEVYDHGDDWNTLKSEGKIFSYTNKFEPDFVKSYVVFDCSLIKSVVGVSIMSYNELESIVEYYQDIKVGII